MAYLRKNVGTVTGIVTQSEFSASIQGINEDVAVLGFKTATADSLVKYDLVDQLIDDFQDTSFVDTSASTGEIRDASAKSYSGGTSSSATQQKTYTGSDIAYVVPVGITSMTAELWGAGGGSGGTAVAHGGAGGYTKGTIAVTAGETLTLIVGQGGGSTGTHAGGGGGGTWIKRSTTMLLAAGGGGGSSSGGYGGGGGGGNGSDGATVCSNNNGKGATTVAGGAVGDNGGTGNVMSSPGKQAGAIWNATNGGTITGTSHSVTRTSFGGGGAGGSDDAAWSAGGGGGGYYGGGSSGLYCGASGGGGGAGYTTGATSVTVEQGGVDGSNNLPGGDDSTNYTDGIGDGGDGSGSSSSGSGSNGEIYMSMTGTTAADITLISNASTAESVPTKADIVLTYSTGAGTITENTDIKAYASRDDGTTYTQFTLIDKGDSGTHTILVAHDLDISGQPSESEVRYKITTHNQTVTKYLNIHAVSLGWS